jgi:hypothetical protein
MHQPDWIYEVDPFIRNNEFAQIVTGLQIRVRSNGTDVLNTRRLNEIRAGVRVRVKTRNDFIFPNAAVRMRRWNDLSSGANGPTGGNDLPRGIGNDESSFLVTTHDSRI